MVIMRGTEQNILATSDSDSVVITPCLQLQYNTIQNDDSDSKTKCTINAKILKPRQTFSVHLDVCVFQIITVSVHLVYPTAVTVGFQRESYSVIEDEVTLEVCVVVSGERERDFSVDQITQGGTAEGGLLSAALLTNVQVVCILKAYTYAILTELEDFQPLAITLVFDPVTPTILCIDISIVNNGDHERNEIFSMHLTSSDSVVITPSATVAIQNDDPYSKMATCMDIETKAEYYLSI